MENSEDKSLKEAMLKLAIGYEYEEKIIEAKKDGTPAKIRIIKKQMPPNYEVIKKIRYLKSKGKW